MNKLIGLIQKLTIPILIVVITLTGGKAYAIAPVLDLDADDSRVVGFGYYVSLLPPDPFQPPPPLGITTTITDDDILITDSDSNKISRAVITIINPKLGDRLDQNDLKGQLTYDPSSTDTQLIITGSGLLEKYETALRSITFSNQDYVDGIRLISVIVEDVMGQSSNTAVTAVDAKGNQVWIRGYIYTTIHNALNSVTLNGAVVSLSRSDGAGFDWGAEESADLYIMYAASDVCNLHVSLPGYEAKTVENVTVSPSNDPSNPIQIYLNPSDADADVVPDGQLNAGDFLVATRIVLGLKTATTEELAHGDMNGDGQINLSDLTLILQAIQSAP